MNKNNSVSNQLYNLMSVCKWGGVATIIVILLTVVDVIAGSMLGGDLTSIPQSAVGRFTQFNENSFLGLYNLDLLNMIVSVIMIPSFLALFIIHREDVYIPALLALTVFTIGTTIFIANNSALAMLELSKKFVSATSDEQRMLISAAGETLITRGAHGGYGVFPGFLLITLSELLISVVMLKGKVFSKTTAVFGIAGTSMLIVYLIFVTFIPSFKTVAMILAAPGGLLSLVWMIMYTTKLFKFSAQND